MSADRQNEDEEDQTRQVTRTVRNYGEGVLLMLTAMVEYAHRDAQRGDVSAKAFLADWQVYFSDRHHGG